MATKTLTNPKGISSRSVINVPDQWSADWFRTFLKTQFSNADVRNATPGTGIAIDGTSVTTATISVDDSVGSLFHEPYLLATAPSDTVLDKYRTLAVETSVLAIQDNGPIGALTVSVAAHGITDAKLRNGAAASVIGNATTSLGPVADILATNDNTVLQRASGALTFGAVPLTALAAQGNNTVVGNFGAGTAAPTALTQGQLTSLINVFSATLSGSAPHSTGLTTDFLRADGVWQTLAANPSAKVGPTAANGSAATFMRSDAAPAIDLTANYAWTGTHSFTSNNAGTQRITVTNSNAGAAALNLLELVNNASVAFQLLIRSSAAATASEMVVQANGGPLTIQTIGAFAIKLLANSAEIATLDSSPTTGAQTATFTAANKPGSGTTAPTKWLPVKFAGTQYYIPMWQ